MASSHPPSSSTPAHLDFLSPEFDALKALYAVGLEPPNPRVKPSDNLNKFRRLLPQEVPESLANVPARVPRTLESIIAQQRAKARTSLATERAAERARQTPIVDAIAAKLKNGPLGLLVECFEKRGRVQVWTRHAYGIRGTLVGFLQALDKHLNMVLTDVDETYTGNASVIAPSAALSQDFVFVNGTKFHFAELDGHGQFLVHGKGTTRTQHGDLVCSNNQVPNSLAVNNESGNKNHMDFCSPSYRFLRKRVPRLVRQRGRGLAKSHSQDKDGIGGFLESGQGEPNTESKTGPEAESAVEDLTTAMMELKLFPKLEHRRRHLNQIFVRGDSVVMVRRLP